MFRTDAADNTTVYDYGLGEGAAYPGLLNAVHYPTYTERYDYDQRDRPATITEQYGAQSRDTRYQYLPDGNLVGSTDAAGRDSASSYDALGRLTGETDADGGATAYRYDDRDNLIIGVRVKLNLLHYDH